MEKIDRRFNKPLMLTLMFAVFLNMAGFFMPMPIFAPLFLHSPLLAGYMYKQKALLLGVLVGCYGVAQLFGAPLLGKLSDKYGRKKVLLYTLLVSAITTFLGGFAIVSSSIVLIFICRFMLGFVSGTLAIVLALVAGNGDSAARAKRVGYINIGVALGAALGPIIAGYITTLHQVSLVKFSAPFFFFSICFSVCFCLIYFLLPLNTQPCIKEIPVSVTNMIHLKASKKHILCFLIVSGLLFQISAESFYLAGPIVAVQELHLVSSQIGVYFSLQGFIAIFVSWWVNKYLIKRFNSVQLYIFSLLFLSLCLLTLLIKNTFVFAVPFLALGIFGTLAWIHINALFSCVVSDKQQGLVFGVSQSLWSLGGFLGSMLIGIIAAFHYHFSILIPSIFMCLSFMVILPNLHKIESSIK